MFGIRRFIDSSGDSKELALAQFSALSQQIPLLYAIVIVNTLTLSYVHYGLAPKFLTIGFPAFFCVIGVVRTLRMAFSRGKRRPSIDIVRRQLRLTIVLGIILGAAMTAWAIALFSYGDAFTKGHVTLFIGLNMIAVITCLMPLRQVASLIFVLVAIPSVMYLLSQPEMVYRAIAVNILLVSGAMGLVLLRSNTEFRNSVEKQRALDEQKNTLLVLNRENRRLAAEDSLTGLPNRRCFFEKLEETLEERTRTGEDFVLGLLDLDGFKPINDIFGHAAGDRLLIEVARRMQAVMPDDGFLARLGGDEFAIILPHPGTNLEAESACDRIVDAMSESFDFDDGSATISATIGLARFPDASRNAQTLYERADYALYYTKQNNKGHVGVYSIEHETILKEVSMIAQRLREADLDNELSVVFQPIVDHAQGETKGFEALARWHNPVLGKVSPELFIRSAEQMGIISKLTLVLLQKAVDAAAAWPEDKYLSFNLSAYELCSTETIQSILALVDASPLPTSRLVFEITETAVMQDFSRANQSLKLLREAGAQIALDDFGTGYSSLSYVRQLPLDRLKIDRSFIMDIETDQASMDIVKSIVDLCCNLKIDCIVEGVETEPQLQMLESIGCRQYQGFYFSRPMDARSAAQYVAFDQDLECAG
ncbi:MAG: GGDEF-domain containing protein [Hyphomicrobiales bacterium]|nr:MAG: GGDEF-domain containing protein [Hyphomicrobiales bacterium]